MKLSFPRTNFLSDKRVVQLIALLALLNVVAYVIVGKVKAMLTFVAFAVLARFFSKNLAIVLGAPLILVNLLALQGNMLEGMENNDTTNETNTKKVDDNDQNKNNDQSKNNDQNKDNDTKKNNKNKPDPKTGQGLKMNPVDDHEEETNAKEQQGFEPGRRKNRGYEIDYATTVEDAYDQLNSILGGDGIKRLTEDTQGLMKQQMQLAEAMKSMEPMIKQIEPMVQRLNGMMGDGKDGLGGIMNLAKQIAGPKK